MWEAAYASISGTFWNSLKALVTFAMVSTSFVSTTSIGSMMVSHSRYMRMVLSSQLMFALRVNTPSMASRFTARAPEVVMEGIHTPLPPAGR